MGRRRQLWSSNGVRPDNAYANCEQEYLCSGKQTQSHRQRKGTAGLSTLTVVDTEDLENNQKN